MTFNNIFDLFGDDAFDTPTPCPTPTPQVCTPAAFPAMLRCGHLSFHDAEAHVSAKDAGHCCAGGQLKAPTHWGDTEQTLPAQTQRTHLKNNGQWGGYCCDKDGNYIGGIGNDCRFYSPDARRCVAHASSVK